jgi:hypothetical protein
MAHPEGGEKAAEPIGTATLTQTPLMKVIRNMKNMMSKEPSHLPEL